jgi:ACS family hexuronate transporter-like MFS transporter
MKPPASLAPSAAVRPGYCRWVVCGLLFFATTINYIDRQVIGILKPTLMKAFQWQDERIYAAIIFSFQFAYAIGLVVAGRVMDRIGIRRGFALAVVLWSFAAVAHAAADWFPALQLPTLNLDGTTGFSVVMLASAAAGFALARFALGIGGSREFPCGDQDRCRMVSKEGACACHRHLQFGVQCGCLGDSVGGALDCTALGLAISVYCHRRTRLSLGGMLVWIYHPPEEHPRLSAAELAHIGSDPLEAAEQFRGPDCSRIGRRGRSRSANS